MYIVDDDFENIVNSAINSILARCRGLYCEIEDLKRHSKNPSKKTNFDDSINYIKEDIKGIEESINRLKSAYEDAPRLRLR